MDVAGDRGKNRRSAGRAGYVFEIVQSHLARRHATQIIPRAQLDLKRNPKSRSNKAYIQTLVGDDPGGGGPSRYPVKVKSLHARNRHELEQEGAGPLNVTDNAGGSSQSTSLSGTGQ